MDFKKSKKLLAILAACYWCSYWVELCYMWYKSCEVLGCFGDRDAESVLDDSTDKCNLCS